ncbi:MAG: IS701 family transposase [Pyrinomonadaceae bacterium]
MPCELLSIVIAFAPLFTKPVFRHVQVLIQGAILSPASRTVASALRVMGKSDEQNFQNYHRVLNRDEWSSLEAARILLGLLVKVFIPYGVILIGMDDTIERRRGEKIKAKGNNLDPVRSSHSHFVKASGLRWLCFMLLVKVPFAQKVWALPFLSVLCPSERYDEERGVRHRKLTDRARQSLLLIARWLVGRKIVVVADSSFAALELLSAVKEKVTVVTRLRLDAALYEPAPQRKKGQLGRPRKKGKRLATLQQAAQSSKTKWEKVSIKEWYGCGEREVEITSGTCVWYHTGKEAVPIRWVLIRDPQGKFDAQALLCTKLEAESQQIIKWFTKRWQLEVTFEEARRHLGIETQRQWSDKAIMRTTPSLLGMYSIVTMLAQELAKEKRLTTRSAAWYEKEVATFSDAIAAVRRYLWASQHFQTSKTEVEMIKIPRAFIERLTDTLCYAA